MPTEQDYLDLNERFQRLLREHAVLEAQEKEKAVRREELIAQLQKAGIDTDHPEREIERLEREANEVLAKAKADLDAFEKAMKPERKEFGLQVDTPPLPSIFHDPPRDPTILHDPPATDDIEIG